MIQRIVNPDRALQMAMGSLIDAASWKDALGLQSETWLPGMPLKLLFAGYAGSRNTGADVRVEEMIRQVRHVLGDNHIQLSITTIDPEFTSHYFRTVRQVHLPQIFPKFLYDECPRHHGVVACEGSMFKSKWADALTVMMAGALGMAGAEGKLAVGYGAEAGEMNLPLRKFVAKHCRDVLVLCRNNPSREILEEMGIRTKGGTDTAWTFEPSTPVRGAELLKKKGWNGKQSILAVCPINPFWWPVKPDLVRFAARKLAGQFKDQQYKSIYFHTWTDAARKQYQSYLKAFASATQAFAKEQKLFTVVVGMEMLDRQACEDFSQLWDSKPPLLISNEYDMYDLVSILRHASFLASSRFHAIVTTMPTQVPSVGIAMDERIRNLMNDRGHSDLSLEVTDEALEGKLLASLRKLAKDSQQIKSEIGRTVSRQLELMGQMGIDFADEVHRVYPEFPSRGLKRSWEANLPPLSKNLKELLKAHA